VSSAALAYPKVAEKSAEAFRTISEVAAELDVPQHVLRFWESRFNQIKPVKRAGGRRYYRPDDVDLLKGIQALLYSDGFTIKGVQKVLKDRGLRHVAQLGRGGAPEPVVAAPLVVEKVVYIEKPAPAKKRPTHLRAVPDMSLPFFDEPVVIAATPSPVVEALALMPVVEAPVVETAPDIDRAKLEALLAELTGLKARFRRK
jgi:DNA-binding transcriptional MerR regulator